MLLFGIFCFPKPRLDCIAARSFAAPRSRLNYYGLSFFLSWVSLIERTPPPGGVTYQLCALIRTVCKRTPLEGLVPGSSRGSFTHGSWWGSIVNRKHPRGGSFFRSIWFVSTKSSVSKTDKMLGKPAQDSSKYARSNQTKLRLKNSNCVTASWE